jgi:ribosomal protein S12 methylthiotransferase accessory factor
MTAVAAPVLVRGDGALAAILAQRLAGRASHQTHGPGPALVLVLRLDELNEIEQFLTSEMPSVVLVVAVWRSWVYVGPLWQPGTPCCPRCLLSRVTDSPIGLDQNEHEWVTADKSAVAPVGSGPAVPHVVATMVEARLDESLKNGDGSGPQEVLVYDSHSGEVSTYLLVADSLCPVCGPPLRGTLPAFTDDDQPLRKIAPSNLRIRDVDSEMLASHVSPIGLFRRLRIDLQSPFGACSIELPESKGYPRNPALGRGISYARSRAVAVLEGLERHCGLHRGGRRAFIRAAYQDVADRAIYPPSFGMHPATSYKQENFKFSQFAPDTIIDWVEAYSFARKAPVLVPERAAFWGPRDDGEVTFFQESSNGCALGSCIEEAILHGLLEVIERDSFLLTWYRKLRLPELDLQNDADLELRTVLHKSELFTGCKFRAFLSTMEHGMPSVWLTAIGEDPHGPAVLAGAGAHPDPRQAVIGAIYELAKRVLGITHYYPTRRAEALSMLEASERVKRLEHHPMVNCLPEARHRFSFLLDRETTMTPIDSVPATICATSDDLRDDLATAVRGMLECGFDVLVVDQTMPEVAINGLACVKVMSPGLLPISFGHVNRRTEHLPRLTGAAALPYESSLSPGEEPGLVPHPFD